MGLDCEYPNPCDCGCQDEPTRTGCKCCGREDHHATDCLIPENARLRARIAELERGAEVMKEINAHIRKERDSEHERAEENAALANSLRAERDRYLAAIVEYVGVEDVKEIEVAYAALRRIAEEKP